MNVDDILCQHMKCHIYTSFIGNYLKMDENSERISIFNIIIVIKEVSHKLPQQKIAM